MKNMRNKQYGNGFVGWCSILGIVAFFVLLTLRVMPLYSEKYQIIKSMEGTANQPNAKGMSKTELRKIFQKNIDVTSNSKRFRVNTIKDLVKVVKDKKTGKRYLHVAYEGRNVFVKDLEFLLVFDHKVELGGSGDE
jgi:hypothetical protein